MNSYQFSTALELRDDIAKKRVSPVEVVKQTLERIEAAEPRLNCFVTLTPDVAMDSARRAEKAIMRGDPVGPLHGIPISVKDLIAVGGIRQTFGSRAMAENIATVDAPSVSRVISAGACIVGKTTTSEFGCKAVGDSPLSGITRNPWDVTKTPGGSSCGAAASVAAGLTPFALGTDGGGSIRAPAAFTGIFGIKPQFARVPVFPPSATPTLGHVGPLARTVRDAALLLGVIAGGDTRDPFSLQGSVPDFLHSCEQPVKGMKIAWSPNLGYAKPTAEVVSIVESALMNFKDMGCEVVLLKDGIGADPADLWMAEFYAGVGTRLSKILNDSPQLLDAAVADTLAVAINQGMRSYYQTVFDRYDFRERVRAVFEEFDLLLSPTLPIAACDVGVDVPKELEGSNLCTWQYYTYPFNLTGQPAASVPVGFTSSGLPVGMQMVAKLGRETDIFRAAAAFEEARPWATLTPPFA
ncbi:aspartyl-tRNA(Asn)/glutamyl-tRNA(Gln) amidotransferase subunit A [Paraburkholderia sp. BL27I4N3]|uniref:amidase n=1 Tax=Paraburkholderia sp. BL27I4N3 TaxID=1938805 RepID=UPI000E242855|nr:amidase family protein [Paraburkholderia sp. BL27I4N3]REE23177.1 aspartyl-tRNA(Asn)/glutamyl-tRNA(Gln) amidotransferase subunit A [Paraburkholderia sp. BL27I4N3]